MSADSDDDRALFRKHVGPVRKLHHDSVDLSRPRPRPQPRRESEVLNSAGHDDHGEPLLTQDSEPAYDWHRPGLQKSVLRKLRRGQYSIGDELDLHGLTASESRKRLLAFLEHAKRDRLSCVRIVTGKGLSSPGMKAVLKPRVATWLRDHSGVLAFTQARRNDGGSGAFYVLLRSRHA